ncbi:MAG: hypothetical protein QOH21_2897 [Acidobacteriota bacterium]|jgi:hypothetical protein|nr:hypothetical protein [Acidobacteriota bacterium]
MRTLLHFCAAALIVPQLLLTTLFLALGHVTGGHTLGSLFMQTLELAGLLFGWGGLAVVLAVLLLLGAGFSDRARPFASAAIVLLVVGSTVALAMMGIPAGIEDGVLMLPALVAVALSIWLIRADIATTRIQV